MNDAFIPAAGADPLEGRYAGFWQRFAAACVDMLLYFPLYYTIKHAMGREHALLGEAMFALIALLTYAGFFASRLQASPGMWLLRFHVTDEENRRLSYRQSLIWGVVASIGVMICCSGVIYMQLRFNIIEVNQLVMSCAEENLQMDDCIHEAESMLGFPFDTYRMMVTASALLAVFLAGIWSLSVALSRDKSGFHNLICGTRFLKGRP